MDANEESGTVVDALTVAVEAPSSHLPEGLECPDTNGIALAAYDDGDEGGEPPGAGALSQSAQVLSDPPIPTSALSSSAMVVHDAPPPDSPVVSSNDVASMDGSPITSSPIPAACAHHHTEGDDATCMATELFPSTSDIDAQEDNGPAYTQFRARTTRTDSARSPTSRHQRVPYDSVASRVFQQLASPSFAHVTSLLLSGCGLHDEDLAQVFHRADYGTTPPNAALSTTSKTQHNLLLPFLYHLDLSDNLLQTFPTFILGRFDAHAVVTGAATAVVQRSRPASPWIVSVSNNKRMRMFPPLVLECELIGAVSIDGCDALMPNVVVAGFKGLVCGAVHIPDHTDETAVYESMLGLLAINGQIIRQNRRAVAPQHARKCEAHLQTLRRRYTASQPPAPWFVARLLSCLKLDADTRHVVHPRLVERHHRQVTKAAEVYVLDLVGSAFAARVGSTGRFDMEVAPHDDDAVGGAVECMRYGTETGMVTQCPEASRGSSATTTPLVATATSQGPLFFHHWSTVLRAAATEVRLRRIDVAVCALVAHAHFPELCSRNAMLAVVDNILEACAVALASEDESTSAAKAAILKLLDSVELWPAFAFTLFADHLVETTLMTDRAAPQLEGASMQSRVSPERSPARHATATTDDRHWMSRTPDAPTALPLSMLLAEVHECRQPSSAPLLLGGGRALMMDQSIQNLEAHVAQVAQTEQSLLASNLEDSMRRESAALVAQEAHRSRTELMARPSAFNHPRRRMEQQQPSKGAVSTSGIPGLTVASSLGGGVGGNDHAETSFLDSGRTAAGCDTEPVPEAPSGVAPLHTGFLPVRQAASAPRSGGGGLAHAGAYRLVNGREAVSASLARRPPSRQALQSPPRTQQAHINTSCLRLPMEDLQRSQPLSTSSKDATTAFHHLNTTATTTTTGSQGASCERHRSAPRGDANHAGSDASRCKSLVQFLRRRGQLHLQSASKIKAIVDATAIDLEPLRPPSALDSSTPGSPPPLRPPAETNADPASFGCTLDEYRKASRMYPIAPLPHPGTHHLGVDAVLHMIHRLMAPQERLMPGAVYRAFASWLCVTCVEHQVVDVWALPPEAACNLVCACLHHRGTLHVDYELLVDELVVLHGGQATTRGADPDALGYHTGGPPPTCGFISEIHDDGTPGEALSHAVARVGGRPHVSASPMSRGQHQQQQQGPPSQAACAVRLASTTDHALSTMLSSHRVGASSSPTSRPSSVMLADRGSHPFLVQAQATLERERIRGHIRAASATPEDPLMAEAVKRSCSSSLRPLRRMQPTASGRAPTDWVATNHQFIPLLVRHHLSAAAKGATTPVTS